MGRGPKVGQGPKVGRGAGVGPSAPNGGSVGAAVGAGARGMRGGDVTPPTMNPVSGWFGPGGAVLRGACVGNFGEGVVSYRMAGRPVAPTASRLELGEALGTTAAICQGRTPSMDRITSTAMALIVASLKADSWVRVTGKFQPAARQPAARRTATGVRLTGQPRP